MRRRRPVPALLAALALCAACGNPPVPGGGLFVAEPFTAEGSFTPGVEGPAAVADGSVLAVNFGRQGTVGRVLPDGRGEIFAELPAGSVGNGLRIGPDGTVFVADYTGHNILAVDPVTRWARVLVHEPAMSQPNDLALAPDGATLYASDPDWTAGTGRIWRVGTDRRAVLAASGLGTANGVEVSPDGRTLYVGESAGRRILAFTIAADGALAGPRTFAAFPDFGLDGMRCDVDGNLYVARYGKGTVAVLSPDGEVLREIGVLGARPSNLCFGGPDGRTVYVTEVEHGRLVRFRTGRPGREWGRPERTPQFVCVSSDDNGYAGLPGSPHDGGLGYLTELFARLRNPAGAGEARTFDGAPPHYTFFVNTRFVVPDVPNPQSAGYGGGDAPALVLRAWREAVDRGHEIAVHTHSHPHGRDLSVAEWEREIGRSMDILTRPASGIEPGLGIPRQDLAGFRAPFIEPSDSGMAAVLRSGLAYDSSVEEGPALGPHPGAFPWPYRLDAGIPAHRPPIGPHPGLWEMPLGNFVAPPDEACARYGLRPGLRAALARRQAYFQPANGEITGMDWNLWIEFSMSPAEFLATVEYTLDRHAAENRSPMTVGLHSELYTVKAGGGPVTAADIRARRAALESFFAYALSKPEVRLVSHRELLAWLERPALLPAEPGLTSRPASGPGRSRPK
ncbi:MAG: polysaccharide deacetylase family protein [Acidobacteria bacterium]|nr:polysaccharide deacetylase family protein [Acidobacteriota bacterium]